MGPLHYIKARGGGLTLWLTGMSGAGKSTLAARIARELRSRRLPVELLDGDEVRENLSRGLGFSRQDRDTNVRRIGYVARLLSRNGVVAVVAAISPYRETRLEVRELHRAGNFIEVHVDCPLATLIDRDVKGLYRRALSGEIAHFTGVSDPYEPPRNAEIVVRSAEESVEESAGRILDYLEDYGWVEMSPETSMPAGGVLTPSGDGGIESRA